MQEITVACTREFIIAGIGLQYAGVSFRSLSAALGWSTEPRGYSGGGCASLNATNNA